MPSEPILKVENLSVEFDGNKIIQDLSFEVDQGGIVAVIGPNGAGKTVLFRALLGLIPYSGKINWRTGQAGAKIGYVPQRFIVERDLPLTVKEFLSYLPSNFRRKTWEGENKIAKALELVGLHAHLLNVPLGVLSGGELQKVLIAFALLGNPEILLFDEPTTGIDIGGEETIYNLLRKLKNEHGLTIIFISHDIHVVYQYAGNVLCLNKKKICFGPPHEALSAEELRKLYGAEVGIYPHTHA